MLWKFSQGKRWRIYWRWNFKKEILFECNSSEELSIKEYEIVAEKLFVKKPTFAPRVTLNMDSILNLIKTLVEKKHAYVSDGNVYFDVSSFNGKKFLILSTVNAFGGKNSFLGISYIVLGGISIILAIIFIIGYNIHSKKTK